MGKGCLVWKKKKKDVLEAVLVYCLDTEEVFKEWQVTSIYNEYWAEGSPWLPETLSALIFGVLMAAQLVILS